MTALIIESYKELRRDEAKLQTVLLQKIVFPGESVGHEEERLLATLHVPFHPDTNIVVSNFLFFLSLGFALACALAATMVEQWARNYLNDSQLGSGLNRSRIRTFLHQGTERFGLVPIVESIPFLLHLSLFLFFAGLATFLFPINTLIGSLCIVILISCTSLYTATTILPIWWRDCPFRTPLTSVVWFISHRIRRQFYAPISRKTSMGNTPSNSLPSGSAVHDSSTLFMARVVDATWNTELRDAREREAVLWLLGSFTEDDQVEALAELVPALISELGIDSYVDGLAAVLNDSKCVFPRQIVALLYTCRPPSFRASHRLHDVHRQRRATTCLTAMSAILRASFHCYSPASLLADGDHMQPWFHLENTLNELKTVRDPNLAVHRQCVYVLILCKLVYEMEDLLCRVQFALKDGADPVPIFQPAQSALRALDHGVYIDAPASVGFRAFGRRFNPLMARFLELSFSIDKRNDEPVAPSHFLAEFRKELRWTYFSIMMEYILSPLPSVNTAQHISPMERPDFDRTLKLLWLWATSAGILPNFDERTALVEEALTFMAKNVHLESIRDDIEAYYPPTLPHSPLDEPKTVILESITALIQKRPGGSEFDFPPQVTDAGNNDWYVVIYEMPQILEDGCAINLRGVIHASSEPLEPRDDDHYVAPRMRSFSMEF